MDVPQNSALPDYLPEEEESPVREVDRAISRTTAKEDSSGSWLNAAASFLTKTFYWWISHREVLLRLIPVYLTWMDITCCEKPQVWGLASTVKSAFQFLWDDQQILG